MTTRFEAQAMFGGAINMHSHHGHWWMVSDTECPQPLVRYIREEDAVKIADALNAVNEIGTTIEPPLEWAVVFTPRQRPGEQE